MGKQGRQGGQRDGVRRGKDRAFPPGTTRGGVRYASRSPNPNPQPNPPVPPPRPSLTSSPTPVPSKPPKYISPGTELGKQIRETYALLKTLHHTSNLDSGPQNREPKIIVQLKETLSKAIKPAYLNPKTLELVQENARAWGVSTMRTLQDHYKAKLAQVIELLEGYPNPNWEVPLQVATKWAKRNLPRMKQEVLDKARTILASLKQTKNKNNLDDETATEIPIVLSPTPTPHGPDPRLDIQRPPGQRRKTLQLQKEAPQINLTPTKVQTQTKLVNTATTQQATTKTTPSKPKITSVPHQLDPHKLQNLFRRNRPLDPGQLKLREYNIVHGIPLLDTDQKKFVVIDISLDRTKDRHVDLDKKTGQFYYTETGQYLEQNK